MTVLRVLSMIAVLLALAACSMTLRGQPPQAPGSLSKGAYCDDDGAGNQKDCKPVS